jgi:lipase ATG15
MKKELVDARDASAASSEPRFVRQRQTTWTTSKLAKFFMLLITCSLGAFAFRPVLLTRIYEPSNPTNMAQDPILLAENNDGNGYGFSLKHILHHNTEKSSNFHAKLDITTEFISKVSEYASALTDDKALARAEVEDWGKKYYLSSVPKTIRRLEDRSPGFVESYLEYARTTVQPNAINFNWVDEDVLVPNMTDKETVLTLAYMSANAYVGLPYEGDWQNLTSNWNASQGIGWMEDGLRGYVFVDDSNSTVVIAVKGTSANIFFNDGGDTVSNDKINDNLLFSCCCARISYLWNTVCDCYTGESYTCDQNCLETQLYSEDNYYRAALDLYKNVTALYPDANIWITGHSLGGAVGALLGRTYGAPAVSFEAPGELLASKRLHLPMPPGVPMWEDYIWHVGHTADPVFMGVCNGAGSACWIGGYAMETQCHSGLQCVYDVVNDLGWHVSLVNHRILLVINEVLTKYNTTPECVVPPPCKDCFNWRFVSPGEEEPEPTTTSSIPAITTSTTITTTTTESPEKCLKWSWWGRCIEYGPDDPVTTTEAETTKRTSISNSVSTTADSLTATPTNVPQTCVERAWYGRCIEYASDIPMTSSSAQPTSVNFS